MGETRKKIDLGGGGLGGVVEGSLKRKMYNMCQLGFESKSPQLQCGTLNCHTTNIHLIFHKGG